MKRMLACLFHWKRKHLWTVETNHANEQVAWMAINNGSDLMDQNGDLLAESGKLTTDENWATVTLNNRFNKPIVLMGGLSSSTIGEPATIRVRNVSENSFQVRVQEWDYLNGNTNSTLLNYFVVEGGASNRRWFLLSRNRPP